MAIAVAKHHQEVLSELPDGSRHRWHMANVRRDYDRLRERLGADKAPVLIGFEANEVYHRPLD